MFKLYVWICVECVHLSVDADRSQCWMPLELKLRIAVSHLMECWELDSVLWKSSTCIELLGHLSSPSNGTLMIVLGLAQ